MDTLLNSNRTKTEFIPLSEGKIAYRVQGEGRPLILCNRFRGTLDTWDPLFLDSLARHFKVITFDYPGIGYSTGKFPDTIYGLSTVLKDLADALKLDNVALAGWSFGGYIVQVAGLQFEDRFSHLILIGSNPPGHNNNSFEPAFLEKALIPINSEEDEAVLFFEPESAFSIETSKASHKRIYSSIDVSKIPSTQEVFDQYFTAGRSFTEDRENLRDKLKETTLPVLVLHGDHDVSFAIENWFPFLRQLKNGQFIIYTRAGHGPQHQLPELSAKYMADFIGSTAKQ